MKLKDILTKVSENKSNGQLVTCFRKNKMKKAGITKEDLLDMKINKQLKVLLED
ncbi:MAG: hypothetical protein ACLFPS_05825 [Clostridia bacterium]